MTLRLAVTAALLLLPAVAATQTPEVCQALKLRLATLPRIIGSTQEVRRDAEELRYQNDEIRYLRSEMRRARCGAGSIVRLGQERDVCSMMAADLREAEEMRSAVLARRAASRQLIRPSEERSAILAALETNECGPVMETAPQPVAARPENTPDEGNRPYSGITTLKPRMEPLPPLQPVEIPPPPPERPYDPSRKVRSVGPVFLPDDTSIDLANPADGGIWP